MGWAHRINMMNGWMIHGSTVESSWTKFFELNLYTKGTPSKTKHHICKNGIKHMLTAVFQMEFLAGITDTAVCQMEFLAGITDTAVFQMEFLAGITDTAVFQMAFPTRVKDTADFLLEWKIHSQQFSNWHKRNTCGSFSVDVCPTLLKKKPTKLWCLKIMTTWPHLLPF